MWSLQPIVRNEHEVHKITYAKNVVVCLKSQEGLLGYRDYHGPHLSWCTGWHNSIYSSIILFKIYY